MRLDGTDHHPLDLELNEIKEISLNQDQIKITSIDHSIYHICFKNHPEPPSTIQAISHNIYLLINKADTVYPQYINHRTLITYAD